MKNTVENNVLIAEFMGYELNSNDMGNYYRVIHVINSFPIDNPIESLQYNESYDWLMPVVDKIETIKGFEMAELQTCTISGYSFTFYFDSDDYSQQRRVKGETKLQATYNAVVEFIKWYNKKTEK